MKITEMHLDDFGIYHNVSWNPPEHGLIVMHGRNESGKTTLMKYVRSMFFGYLRGDWKGYFGSMGIRREDGKEYRIVRNEKEYFLSDGQEKVQEEPAICGGTAWTVRRMIRFLPWAWKTCKGSKSCPMKPCAAISSASKAASAWAWPAVK